MERVAKKNQIEKETRERIFKKKKLKIMEIFLLFFVDMI